MCACGSAWFELRGSAELGQPEGGAVSIDGHGTVTGYAGAPHCIECGEKWEPGRTRLRAVE